MRRSLPLLLSLALGACASVPMANPQDDEAAKRFDSPPPDRGALYVYRHGWFGVVLPVDVAVAGGTQAQLNSNTYLLLDSPPGPVELSCRTGANTDSRQVDVTQGQTRYIEVAMRPGLLGPSCEVAEVAPEQGQAAVRASRRVQPAQPR